jgi:hypothetical protein
MASSVSSLASAFSEKLYQPVVDDDDLVVHEVLLAPRREAMRGRGHEARIVQEPEARIIRRRVGALACATSVRFVAARMAGAGDILHTMRIIDAANVEVVIASEGSESVQNAGIADQEGEDADAPGPTQRRHQRIFDALARRWREVRGDVRAAHRDCGGRQRGVPGGVASGVVRLRVLRADQLLEGRGVGGRQRRRGDLQAVVILQLQPADRQVGRAHPHSASVAHQKFIVHQVATTLVNGGREARQPCLIERQRRACGLGVAVGAIALAAAIVGDAQAHMRLMRQLRQRRQNLWVAQIIDGAVQR